MVIGVDPHKRSVTIEARDAREVLRATGSFPTPRPATGRCCGTPGSGRGGSGPSKAPAGSAARWRSGYSPRASGSWTCRRNSSARVRVLDAGQGRKTDATDAHAVVMAARPGSWPTSPTSSDVRRFPARNHLSLTDPTSSRPKPPWPREPTTSRSAPSDRRSSTVAGSPASTTRSMSRGASSARTSRSVWSRALSARRATSRGSGRPAGSGSSWWPDPRRGDPKRRPLPTERHERLPHPRTTARPRGTPPTRRRRRRNAGQSFAPEWSFALHPEKELVSWLVLRAGPIARAAGSGECLVDVAPTPVLARLERLHDRVADRGRVPASVPSSARSRSSRRGRS